MGQKIVRYLFFFVCSIIILFVLITLILPSTGRVVKETYIPSRKKVILNQLTSLHNYALWYPWIQIDPTAVLSYREDKKSISWYSAGKDSGNGTYEISRLSGDSALYFKFTYNSTPPITGAFILRPSEDGEGTTVIWYMNMKAGWTPWWRFYAAMMTKLTGPMMETGLTNLKILSEQANTYSNIPIKETMIAKTYAASLTDTAPQNLIYPTLNKLLTKIKYYAGKHNLSVTGNSIAQFQKLNDHTCRIKAGLCVSSPFISNDKIQLWIIPAETVLMANYTGAYAGVQDAYQALSHFAAGFKKPRSLNPWESYPDGKIPQSDSSYCHIKVYYPVLQ